MDRRVFIQRSLQATIAATVVSGATAPLVWAATADALTLFDPRFPRARAYAAALANDRRLLAVNGDPSELALLLNRTDDALVLQGVTTETLPFYLQHRNRYLDSRVLQVSRLNQDLFVWTYRR
jgi:hypothetical protein